MALTPPADGTATYAAPVTVNWFAYDLLSTQLTIPSDLADALTDDAFAALINVVDQALVAKYPTLRITRYTSWTHGAPNDFDSTVIQEATEGASG
ncbi:hypothetical protein [Streptomyces sp. NPDC008150]|uniref:hypothetical protein n=1 Tax=Streptomyces sp. NPDC008150 TaxID=3364816 RepID=UPI0036EA0654